MRTALALIIVGLAASGTQAAGTTVRAVVPPVRLIHDGAQTPAAVKAGMLVADTDELIGGADASSVQLECPNGATQTLSGKFDAVVNGSGAKSRCAIDLKSGTAVATVLPGASHKNTDNDASISGGPYAMTSHHTQFGLSVTPGAKSNTAAFVIDGEALVRAGKTAAPASLKQGQMWSAASAKIERIPRQTFERIARAYTQLDLAQLSSAASTQLTTRLQSKWLASLEQPESPSARKALAEMHMSLGLANSLVSKYQIARANGNAGTAASIASQFGNIFRYPMNGEYRLDYCLPNNKCGKDTAMAWCQGHGYSRAATWKWDFDIGAKTPTQRMGSSEVCNRRPCDGFASITCE